MSRTKRSDALDKYSSKGGKSRKKSDVKIIDDDDDIPYEPEIDEAVDEGPIVVTENYITLGTSDDNANDRNSGEFYEQKRKKKDSKRRRKRYDSDDSSSPKGEIRQKKRYDSDDSLSQRDLKKRRKRFDSDDEDQRKASRKASRRRYDSDDDDISRDRSKSHQKARKRYDSDDDMDHISRKQHGAENGQEESVQVRKRDGDGAKMSSGHSAGLQSVAQFRITENKIQGQKRQDTNELTPGSTVYRDKDGKVLTVSDSAQNPKNNIENDGTWNVGTKQRQDALDRAAEMQSISQSTFARSASDTDRFMRYIAREGDPMASHASKSDRGGKKIYKGPPPKPNRFNIRPGYRWDGVDRGNGFEDKVLAKIYGKGNRDEEHYKYSCADM